MGEDFRENRFIGRREYVHNMAFYAGCRIYTHRHIANQLQSQLNEHNRALEYTISLLSLPSDSSGQK